MDQADTLRQAMDKRKAPPPPPTPKGGAMRVICVTSGKGGVGKTNLVVNLCVALSRSNKRVFLLDADLGLANVDVVLGLTPQYTLEHLMKGQKTIQEVVMETSGFKVLPSSSGLAELAEMTYEQQMFLFGQLSQLDGQVDLMLIDTGAGISSNVLRFNASANEVVVVATPEPTSITDAYALMKLLAIKYHIREFSIIANMVASDKEGQAVFQRLNTASQHFLNVTLKYLGCVPNDPNLRKAVRAQKPLLLSSPASPAAKRLIQLADVLLKGGNGGSSPEKNNQNGGAEGFWDRLLHWKKA